MSEEKEGGFFGQLKNQILTGVGVAITAGSTLFLDVVKEKLGLVDEEPAQTEQVIQQPTQPQNITINLPEQKKDTVVKKVYVKPPPPPPKKTETEKRKDEGFDW
jgi:type IV secretory pathway VirB10-like protein